METLEEFSVIMGAMAAGSEYGWGTLKTVLSQRPGKLAMLSGKLLALALLLLVFVVRGLAAGAAGSLVVETASGGASRLARIPIAGEQGLQERQSELEEQPAA